MALFLMEHTKVAPQVSLEEALGGLVELMIDGNSLTEAIYRADFTIHQRTQTLTEEGKMAEAAGAAKNFLVKAWAKIKEFAIKVYEKVKQVVIALVDRVAKMFGSSKIDAGQQYKVNKVSFEKCGAAASAIATITKQILSAADKEAVEAKVEAARKAVTLDASDQEKITVKGSEVLAKAKAIEGTVKGMSADLEAVKKAVADADKAVEALSKKADASDAEKETAQKAVEVAKARASGASQTASIANGLVAMLLKLSPVFVKEEAK